MITPSASAVAEFPPDDPLQTRPDLIIDVGAHNGDDTAYYLRRGFRVVAIEANPVLADALTRRFQEHVERGTVVVLNLGITRGRGRMPFWISEQNSVLSSFDRALVEKHGGPSHAVEVQCLPFSDVLSCYGIPHYLKVDIEGNDRVCLDALGPGTCPKYVSCELTHVEGAIEHLDKLGYRQFKLVNQSTYTEAPPVFDNEIGFRALRKLCRIAPGFERLIPDGLRSDFDTFAERFEYSFGQGCSGPFGEETHGRWRTVEDIFRRHEAIRTKFANAGLLDWCWYDVHAKYE